MKKVITLILMLCLTLSGAFSYARTGNEKGNGTPIEVKEKSVHGGLDKGSTFQVSIDGHYLTVVFTENLGQVTVEVTTSTGSPVDGISTQTPNGVLIYIPLAGDYIVNFTLPNGDEYYGEFTVTD